MSSAILTSSAFGSREPLLAADQNRKETFAQIVHITRVTFHSQVCKANRAVDAALVFDVRRQRYPFPKHVFSTTSMLFPNGAGLPWISRNMLALFIHLALAG